MLAFSVRPKELLVKLNKDIVLILREREEMLFAQDDVEAALSGSSWQSTQVKGSMISFIISYPMSLTFLNSSNNISSSTMSGRAV